MGSGAPRLFLRRLGSAILSEAALKAQLTGASDFNQDLFCFKFGFLMKYDRFL
jgi:hypothetical protein